MDADASADRLAPFEPKNDVKDFCLGGAILAWNQRLSVASRDARALVLLLWSSSLRILHCDHRPSIIDMNDKRALMTTTTEFQNDYSEYI